jgi:hypothetical protein
MCVMTGPLRTWLVAARSAESALAQLTRDGRTLHGGLIRGGVTRPRALDLVHGHIRASKQFTTRSAISGADGKAFPNFCVTPAPSH